MSTIGGSSAATSTTAGMESGVKGASGSLNPTATNFVPPPLGVRLDDGGHGAQDVGRKGKADPWADPTPTPAPAPGGRHGAQVSSFASALQSVLDVIWARPPPVGHLGLDSLSLEVQQGAENIKVVITFSK